jgi:hypothetical protein
MTRSTQLTEPQGGQCASLSVATGSLPWLSFSERQKLIKKGLITLPKCEQKTPRQKPAERCAHHSCSRLRACGRALCEHHLNLQRQRNNRWYAASK